MKKTNITIIISILLAILVIVGAIYFSNKSASQGRDQNTEEQIVNNVSVVNGKQIIEIRAKGGFNPIHSVARAGIPTILRVDTDGTFDCSSTVRIPSMNISQNLPMSGTTDIDIGIQKAGLFQGTCGMGMYPFDVRFE